MPRLRLSYANVMSTVAVFVALGGTSYAVASLPKGSVGERQLKKAAVTGVKIKDGTITGSDLAAGVLGSGPRGPRGATGETGAAGTAAPAEAWRGLSYINGWSNYGSDFELGSFRKDQLGNVSLRGLITRASGTPGGPPSALPDARAERTLAILPPGYRPKRNRVFITQTGENPYQAGRLDIYASGEVVWLAGATGESDYTGLEGVSFSTD